MFDVILNISCPAAFSSFLHQSILFELIFSEPSHILKPTVIQYFIDIISSKLLSTSIIYLILENWKSISIRNQSISLLLIILLQITD